MNTEELKTFIFLSKVKNFTLAAEQMFIAQSTVTNRISELEKEVGKRLFSRGSKTVTLTEEGKIFLKYAERIIELQETSVEEKMPCPPTRASLQWALSTPPMKATFGL